MSGMDVPQPPRGHLSGAPKVHAMEIIDQLEPTKRGLYGGAWLPQLLGDMDVAITIRTGIIMDRPYVQAAAGGWLIPVPELEWKEIGKARPCPGE
jgi:anthranilate synthase component 1